MLNLGIGEVVLVLLVAFLVVGPKDLPKVARWLARQVKNARRLIKEIKKETGWDDFAREFRDTAGDLKAAAKDIDVSADLKDALSEAKQSVSDVTQTVQSAGDDLKGSLQSQEKKQETTK